VHVPDAGAFALLDSVLERMLDDAEHADMRTAVLHVLAIADSARSLAPHSTRAGNPSGDSPDRVGVPAL